LLVATSFLRGRDGLGRVVVDLLQSGDICLPHQGNGLARVLHDGQGFNRRPALALRTEGKFHHALKLP
jgi:hypothetical protein